MQLISRLLAHHNNYPKNWIMETPLYYELWTAKHYTLSLIRAPLYAKERYDWGRSFRLRTSWSRRISQKIASTKSGRIQGTWANRVWTSFSVKSSAVLAVAECPASSTTLHAWWSSSWAHASSVSSHPWLASAIRYRFIAIWKFTFIWVRSMVRLLWIFNGGPGHLYDLKAWHYSGWGFDSLLSLSVKTMFSREITLILIGWRNFPIPKMVQDLPYYTGQQ